MASSTKIIYETKPWLTGDSDLSGEGTSFANAGAPDPRNSIPVRTPGDGLSNYIQFGFSRSVSILFTSYTNPSTGADRAFHAFIIGWIKTGDDTPIYIPVPMIGAVVLTGSLAGFAGSEGADNSTYFATTITIDDTNFKPSGLGNTFAYNNPNASGTISEQGTGDKVNHSLLKMENGWGLDGFQVAFHYDATSGYNLGFLYSLA
mgnify:CR=1 FL=1